MLDLNNIMRIDYVVEKGQYIIDMVALFNKNKITEQEVRDLIESDEYSNKVIKIEKSQFKNVFK